MINKTSLKFYLVPAAFILIILVIILAIPMGNKNPRQQNIVSTPTTIPGNILPPQHPIPTSNFPTSQINSPTPTLIPLRFTGGDLTNDVPPAVQLFSDQKTQLRRKAPLTLPFGTISFDYGNDKFVLILIEPKDQSQTVFNAWLKQTYPAIPIEQFAIQ